MKNRLKIIQNINEIFKDELGNQDYSKYIDLVISSNNDYINYIEYIFNRLSEIYSKKINNSESAKSYLSRLKRTLEKLKNTLFTQIEEYNSDQKLMFTRLKETISSIKKTNENFEKNKHNQREMSNFKQSIYLDEIKNIIEYLIHNFENNEIFPNFISILLYVAKRRKIIEILKLNEEYQMFGSFRTETKRINNKYKHKEYDYQVRFESPIVDSKGNHLINELGSGRNIWTNRKNKFPLNNHAFKYNGIKLTSFNVTIWKNNREKRHMARWIHTKAIYIYPLLLKLNKLYDRFITSNVKSKRLLSKLYWVYMQTCPFERGSASIGEIIFSALLQKYFGCNFKIYDEAVRPEIIPDIYALSYNLKRFQDIFYKIFTTCQINKRNNNNNHNQNES